MIVMSIPLFQFLLLDLLLFLHLRLLYIVQIVAKIIFFNLVGIVTNKNYLAFHLQLPIKNFRLMEMLFSLKKEKKIDLKILVSNLLGIEVKTIQL